MLVIDIVFLATRLRYWGSYEQSGWGDLFPYELGNYFEPQNLANHRVVNIPHINRLPPNLYSSIHTQLGENQHQGHRLNWKMLWTTEAWM